MIKLINILKEVLTETSRSVERRIRDEIVALDPENLRISTRDKDRIFSSMQPKAFEELLAKKYGVDIEVIEPGEPGSKSSQFKTFQFTVNDGKDKIGIVLAKGVQRGEKGELEERSTLESQLKSAIEKAGKSITVKVGDVLKYEINKGEVTKVSGNRMADLSIDGKIFIQHKQEKFQQYSGFIVTERKGKISLEAKQEMEGFVKKVKEKVGVDMPPNKGFKQKVTTSDLIAAALFGSATEEFSLDKVQMICRGAIKLEVVDEKTHTYRITGTTEESYLVYTTGNVPEKWHPYMIARYSSDHNQYGITNCRFNFVSLSYYPGAEVISTKKELEK